MAPLSEIGYKGFKKTGIKRNLVKRLNEQEFKSIVVKRAKNGAEISKNDLKYLLDEKLDDIKNFISHNFYPVVKNGIIINFVDNDNYVTESTKEYDFDDLTFNDNLDCYEL